MGRAATLLSRERDIAAQAIDRVLRGLALPTKLSDSMLLSSQSKHRQFAYFLLCGGIAAVVNFLSRIGINRWLPYAASIVLAYLLGMVTAFILNRWLVFTQASNRLRHQMFWFTLVNLAAVVQTLAVSLLLARVLFPWMKFDWHSETVAHAFGVAIPVVTSFVGHKYLSFRSS